MEVREIVYAGWPCRVIGDPSMVSGLWFDFDDVCSNTGLSKQKACYNLYGKNIDPTLLDSARLEQAGLTKEQYKKIQSLVYKSSGEESVLVPINGAIEGIKKILSSGQSLGILTARFEDNELKSVDDFFLKNGISIPIVGVGYEASKQGAKAHVLEELGARWYIDDDIKMIHAIQSAGSHSFYLGWFDPDDDETQVGPGAIKITSWKSIPTIVGI